MDTFQLNKIAGAVLGTLTVLLGVNVIVQEVFTQKTPEKPGYEVAVKEPEAAGGGAGGAPAGVEALLASADPAKGESVAKRCGACHGFEKGGPAKAGPNLYGIMGAKHAHQEGFGYSEAMKKTADQVWDFANMDKWLENPKGYIQGTSMSFAGIKAPEERANLLAYLNKNSDKPLELPKAPAGGAKPAEGGAPAAAGGGAGGGFAAKVASADPAKGESVAKRCGACHGFEKGGPAKAGPNLYGVVGGKHAHQEGFGYSEAMKKTADKVWDIEAMNKWLENPKGYIAGTSMAFAGIKSEDDRAALIAYMNKNSDKPLDLGGGAAAPAAGGDKKAEGAAPAKPEEQAAAKPAEPAKPEAGKPEAAKPDAAAAPAAGGAEEPVEKRLASADLAKGEEAFGGQCGACHTVNKGGEAGAGPNLYGVVGAKHAHQEGFEYSDAIKGKQGPWTFAELDKWLKSPEAYAPGTMMAFPGVEDPQERANIIAYLNKNSDKPLPTDGSAPAAGAAPAAPSGEAPKPAEGAPPAGEAPKPQ
jgi:cytochrome c